MTASPISWSDPERARAFARWLEALAGPHALDPHSVRAASADASFRRYFRVDGQGGTRIVMDAPPSHEDSRPFVDVAAMLREGGLQAPQVLAWDEARGFMLLSDLGSTTYLTALQGLEPAQAAPHYLAAMETLVRLQTIEARERVPAYNRALMLRELELFPTWYIERHAGMPLDEATRATLTNAFEAILGACLSQPSVLVHRDFHSRNLMVDAQGGAPGVLDFQDAVWGPITYDLASLLRDAYIEWDEEVQIDWAVRYWERARRAGLPVAADFGSFWRDFEWMGLQRHLKVLGIFARLAHRDGKDGYLKDLPLVWRYAHRVATRYRGLGPLALLLERLAGLRREDGYTF